MTAAALTMAAAAALLWAGGARAEEVDDLREFEAWSRENATGEFVTYLVDRQVLGVVPTRELLRTASDWRKCGGPQFQLPPREVWHQVSQVLKLVRELKERKILVKFEAVSAYRNPRLNACAGGARRSSHTTSFAIDILPIEVDERRLCAFWQEYGKHWKMGLSRYPSGRIHLDTTKWRSWGATHGKESAFCR